MVSVKQTTSKQPLKTSGFLLIVGFTVEVLPYKWYQYSNINGVLLEK
jgi:hypothetical protein